MAKTVMQRIAELIDEEPEKLRPFLWEVLKIEQVFLSNVGTGAKDKIQNALFKHIGLQVDQEQAQ